MSNNIKNDTNIKNLDEVTKGYFNVPIEGNDEAHEVWNLLFSRNIRELEKNAHPLFLEGIKELNMDDRAVPKLNDLEKVIQEKVGWVLTPTDTEYSNADDWFKHFENKSFLVTKVIRSRENLDYTPFPEAFHDIFGHLPFLCSKEYMDIAHQFGVIYQELKTEEEKQQLSNFWWYTFEFGLMKDKTTGELKAFGAGLMSSIGERNNAFSGKVELVPFNVDEMKNTSNSAHEFHQKLFIIDSLDQIKNAIDNWK
ncbi:MAG: hypothetical protein AAB438_00020 [Patescibacteria group bacterium]